VAAATLEGCVAGVQQAARAATFSGQMTSVAGAQRMAIRIELEQRRRVGGPFRPVLAPGLGVWRISEAGVKIYKYIKEVTNLAAPASYRALIRFKWLGARSKVVKQEALRTAVCRQPVPAGATETPPGPGAVSGSGTPAAPVARMLT
jgi:hypothetical protein